MDALSGLRSYEQIREEVLDAATDPQVRGILLDIDSPGGEAAGMFDLMADLREATEMKPVYAAANDDALSAAYGLASVAKEIFVTRTGSAGSVGVIAVHLDESKANEQAGKQYTLLRAGARKAEHNSLEPLIDNGRASLQAELDRLHELFINEVSASRQIDPKQVRATDAQVYHADNAVAAGFADAGCVRPGSRQKYKSTVPARATAVCMHSRRRNAAARAGLRKEEIIMARAYGYNAQLLFAYESTCGTPPATGAYFKLPVINCDLGGEQALIEDDVLGLGRDPRAPIYDLKRITGQVEVPLEDTNFGYWLKLLLGAPTTAGAGPYTHTFTSGKALASMESAAIELGYSEIPRYYLCDGVRADALTIRVQRSGKMTAVFTLVGQDETDSTVDATPNENSYNRFDAFEGNIQHADTDLANVLSGEFTFRNNIESVETLRSDALIEAAEPGICALSGSISTRYADQTLYGDAEGQSGIQVDFDFISGANSLKFNQHEVYRPLPKRNVSGPGGVEADYDYQAAFNTFAGEMFEVILINSLANYDNAV